MQVGETGYQHPVHLLRIRRPFVEGSQTRFDVADFCLHIESRKGGGECRQGVAVNQCKIGGELLKYRLFRFKYSRGQRLQRLSRLHQPQVVVGFYAEGAHNRVGELAVLTGEHYPCFELRAAQQLQRQRAIS